MILTTVQLNIPILLILLISSYKITRITNLDYVDSDNFLSNNIYQNTDYDNSENLIYECSNHDDCQEGKICYTNGNDGNGGICLEEGFISSNPVSSNVRPILVADVLNSGEESNNFGDFYFDRHNPQNKMELSFGQETPFDSDNIEGAYASNSGLDVPNKRYDSSYEDNPGYFEFQEPYVEPEERVIYRHGQKVRNVADEENDDYTADISPAMMEYYMDKKDSLKRVDQPKKGSRVQLSAENYPFNYLKNLDPSSHPDDGALKKGILEGTLPSHFYFDNEEDIVSEEHSELPKGNYWFTFAPKPVRQITDSKNRENLDSSRYEFVRTDYTYIRTNLNITDQSIAYKMLSELAKKLKLPLNTFSNIKIKGKDIVFKINPNLKSINASLVALYIQVFKSKLEAAAGGSIKIQSAGIGSDAKLEKEPYIWQQDKQIGSRVAKSMALSPSYSDNLFLEEPGEGTLRSRLKNYDKIQLKSKILFISSVLLVTLTVVLLFVGVYLLLHYRRNKKLKEDGDGYEKGLIEDMGSDENTESEELGLKGREKEGSATRYATPKWARPRQSATPQSSEDKDRSSRKKESNSPKQSPTLAGQENIGLMKNLAAFFIRDKETNKSQKSRNVKTTDKNRKKNSVIKTGSQKDARKFSENSLNHHLVTNNPGSAQSRRNTWNEEGLINKMDPTTGRLVLEYMSKRLAHRQLTLNEWSNSLCDYVPSPFTEASSFHSTDLDLLPPKSLSSPKVQYEILLKEWRYLLLPGETEKKGDDSALQNGSVEYLADKATEIIENISETTSTPEIKPVESKNDEKSRRRRSIWLKAENGARLSQARNPWGTLPYPFNRIELAWRRTENGESSNTRISKETNASTILEGNESKANYLKFINASPICESDPRRPIYIAAQGPVEHESACDFWQLVWDRGICIIVNLTSKQEYLEEKQTHFKYWPDKGVQLYDIYEVYLVSEHLWCNDYVVRSFYLKNLSSNETRTLTSFHYTAWCSDGVPSDTKTLLEFRRKINKSYKGRSTPIVVHCSDGSGRTGTYILIDMILSRLNKGVKEIDIEASVEYLRDQRMKMVATKEQYEFSFLAISEEVQNILKALIPSS
ncbi:unnamed protein product [Gordionus sp. m RMFG-2023]|uniref:uncharacterized protein LOC135922778 n=1 Tax=Gordionus sp. m RMFG-2023 TaxID=3053472 RepID=UPI0030E054B1